jgi:hypothetical protein
MRTRETGKQFSVVGGEQKEHLRFIWTPRFKIHYRNPRFANDSWHSWNRNFIHSGPLIETGINYSATAATARIGVNAKSTTREDAVDTQCRPADVNRHTSQSEDAGRHTDIHHHFYLPVEHSPLTPLSTATSMVFTGKKTRQ